MEPWIEFFNQLVVLLLLAWISFPSAAMNKEAMPDHEIDGGSSGHGFDDEEQFWTMLAQTDSLRSTDLAAAFESANESLELAKTIGSPEFEIVAQMDVASIQCLSPKQDDQSYSADAEVIKLLKLPAGASRRMHGHFELVKFETEFWLGLLNDPAGHYVSVRIEEIEQLAKTLDDRKLQLRAQAFAMFARTYLSAYPTRFAPNAIEKLKRDSKAHEFSDGQIVAILVETIVMDKPKSKERIGAFEKAQLLATKKQCLFWQYYVTKQIAVHHLANKKYEKARTSLHAAGKFANQLNVDSLQSAVELTLVELEKQSKNFKKAGDHFLKYLSLEKRTMEPLVTDYIYSLGQKLVEESGDKDLAKELDVFRLSKQNRKHFYDSKRKIQELSGLVRDSEKKHEEKLENLVYELDRKFDGEVHSLRKSFAMAALIALTLGCVSLFLIVQSRIWAKSRSQEKAVQENRNFYNDLSWRVARMERMESLGMMAGGVAHDFNNILVGVMTNAEVLQMANKDQNGFIDDRLSGIIKSAEEAASLSEKMLVCSGRGVSHLQWQNLNQVVLDYESKLKESCIKNQNLIIDPAPNDIFTNLDVLQVKKAVDNLVINAAEASDEGSKIVIRTGQIVINSAEDNSLFGTRNSGGDFCFIEITDEGCGIPESDIERIFEPFWSKKFVGRGLGLAFVYGIIEGHHGFIQCHSHVGESTKIRLLFPMISQNTDADDFNINRIKDQFEEFTESSNGQDQKKRTKLLLIDDDPNVRKLTSHILQHEGYSPIVASSGEEGLELIDNHSDELLCVLLDVMMPEMRGDRVLELMVERNLNFPVIVLTGYSVKSPKSIEAHPNVVDVIRKPFHARRLLQAIEQIAELINTPS